MIRKHRQEDDAEINITPMLDIVFIMLIFFIVTTVFVKEAGVEVIKPGAESAEPRPQANIMIAIRDGGEIWMSGNEVELRQVRGLVEAGRAENPEGSVMVLADQSSRTGILVQVLDQIRLAGVEQVSIAADEPGAR